MPRLLGDLLSRALARGDWDIVVVETPCLGDAVHGDGKPPGFDIALVSDNQHVPASVVICLADTPAPGVAHIGAELVPIGDLEELVALVDRCCAALERSRPIPSA